MLSCGCDSGFRITGLEIIHYPDNIVYYAGQSTDIDLKGGVIKMITLEGKSNSELKMDEPGNYFTVSHNVDFNTPGVYVVNITCLATKEAFSFPVQVIK